MNQQNAGGGYGNGMGRGMGRGMGQGNYCDGSRRRMRGDIPLTPPSDSASRSQMDRIETRLNQLVERVERLEKSR